MVTSSRKFFVTEVIFLKSQLNKEKFNTKKLQSREKRMYFITVREGNFFIRFCLYGTGSELFFIRASANHLSRNPDKKAILTTWHTDKNGWNSYPTEQTQYWEFFKLTDDIYYISGNMNITISKMAWFINSVNAWKSKNRHKFALD